MKVTPTVKAFLISDQVITCIDGKYSIIGVFGKINVPNLPVFHSRFGVYIKLGGLNGSYEMEIKFIEPKNETVIGSAKLKKFEYKEPLGDFETGINLPGLNLTCAGVHEVHFIVNGQLLHVDTIDVVEIKHG